MNKLKRIGMVAVLTLALSLSVSSHAMAALTFGALTTTSSGALTLTSTSANLTLSAGAAGANEVVITGSVEGTTALTLTAGDAVITDGDLTLSGGEVSITTDDTTTDAVTIVGNTLTTGQALALTYDASTHTSGNVFEISDNDDGVDFAVAEDGATTITGSASGTDALTLTKGDITITDGTLTVSGISTLTGATTITGLLTTSGDITMSDGATLVNTSSDLLTITEATTALSGILTVGGAATITGATTFSAALIGSSENVTTSSADPGVGVAAVTKLTTHVTTDATGDAADEISLADGTTGQLKMIVLKADTETTGLKVIPANFAGGTGVTLEDVADAVTFVFDGTNWTLLSNIGGTIY